MEIRLLDVVPSLGRRLPPSQLEKSRRLLTADGLELPPGEWLPPREEPEPGHLGFLLTSGLIVREIRLDGGWSVELLDHGDLLCPWLENGASFVQLDWRVIERARLAVLDARIARAAGHWPVLIEELIDSAMRRSCSMAVHAAIAATPGVENRLLLLLWQVAERRGRREAAGVRVRLPLTHETLAHLVAARRPSVTTALGQLEDQGTLVRTGRGNWLLRGEPPSPPRQ